MKVKFLNLMKMKLHLKLMKKFLNPMKEKLLNLMKKKFLNLMKTPPLLLKLNLLNLILIWLSPLQNLMKLKFKDLPNVYRNLNSIHYLIYPILMWKLLSLLKPFIFSIACMNSLVSYLMI